MISGARHNFAAAGVFAASIAIGAIACPSPALAIDWSSVSAKDVTLFYPGQSSWEWILTPSDHSGAPKIREGKVCRDCHDGEQADMGALLVSGKKIEPTPIAGKRGSIPLKVKVAHDDQRLYFQFQWTAQDLPDAKPADPDHAEKITVMIDDGTVVEMTRAGCWGACHDDATNMPSNSGEPLEKYLGRSRTKLTRQGGGLNYKSDADLAQMLQAGQFLEYWQAQLNPGQPATAVDGYILKKRVEESPTQVEATAAFAKGVWTVELSGPLHAASGYHKAFAPGKTYTIAFAIHDARAIHRFHHVSFQYTLALDGGDVDFVAAKQ